MLAVKLIPAGWSFGNKALGTALMQMKLLVFKMLLPEQEHKAQNPPPLPPLPLSL
jgi:hypothetical protein